MQQFEDLGPEYREGTYLGRLPKELRQLATRYQESCNYYGIAIFADPGDPNKQTISIRSPGNMISSFIPFQRGIKNVITMREFIFDVKAGVHSTSYNVTPTYGIQCYGRIGVFGLFNRKDVSENFVTTFDLCRELEDALLEVEERLK